MLGEKRANLKTPIKKVQAGFMKDNIFQMSEIACLKNLVCSKSDLTLPSGMCKVPLRGTGTDNLLNSLLKGTGRVEEGHRTVTSGNL